MSRRTLSQILQNAKISVPIEYGRLIELFYEKKYMNRPGNRVSINDLCADNFINMPFRGTCISLNDYDKTHGFQFTSNWVLLTTCSAETALNYLLGFCEYSYNLAFYTQSVMCLLNENGQVLQTNVVQFYVNQVLSVIEKIGYSSVFDNGVTIFVPKDQAAISVAEIIDPSLSYKVLEYNHHLMKGDLEKKKAVLLVLADKLEPQRAKLKQINATLESDLFKLFNNINLRHNNIDPNSTKYIPFVAAMKTDELEAWFDDTYQMCLLAFLELDHLERKERIKQIKNTLSQ